MIRQILLPFDGSPASGRALDLAASLAVLCDASVTVLHSYTPPPPVLGEPNYSRALYATLEEAQALVEDAASRLREQGVGAVEVEVMEGPPTHNILGLAELRKPDLIVLGARGLSTWQGLLLGSVSMTVTHRAESPVLIVK
jgi:nucleotide-binding universal stress UspA family protein